MARQEHCRSTALATVNMRTLLTVPMVALWAMSSSVTDAFSQTLLSPLQVTNASGQCTVLRAEICGDGIDQDCDGVDALCPGNDADNDGYPAGQDCDDGAHFVFPGVSTVCEAGGTRTCRADGTWSMCSMTPLCEATAGGRCYYISPERGNDSSQGSFEAPWRTVANVTYQYPSRRPAGAVDLAAGDVVYFLDGVYDGPLYRLEASSPLVLLDVRGVHGRQDAPVTLQAYPGHRPRFTNHWRTSGPLIVISSSEHIVLDGIEVFDAGDSGGGGGVQVEESTNVDLSRLYVHDIDGVDDQNIAGLLVKASTHVRLSHSVIHDTYDRTAANTGGHWHENSRNVVIYDGGDVRITRSAFFQSPWVTAPLSGNCVSYKHGAVEPLPFEVDHTVFWQCVGSSITTGTMLSSIHHNLFLNSGPLLFRSFKGTPVQQDHRIDHNTIVIADTYRPGNDGGLVWPLTEDYAPIGDMRLHSNVIVDLRTKAANEDATVAIGTWASAETKTLAVDGKHIRFSENCYFAPNSPNLWTDPLRPTNELLFDFFGTLLRFDQWQALGYDEGSLVVDPVLQPTTYATLAPGCAAAGWQAREVRVGIAPGSPVSVGTRVSVTATAEGPGSPFEYRFSLFSETTATWTHLREYDTGETVEWIPAATGRYYVQVWARSPGSSAAWETWANSATIQVVPGASTFRQLTVVVSPARTGRVAGPGIDCPGDCVESFPGRTAISLLAAPGPGWAFSGWTGACAGQQASCTLAVASNTVVQASFTNTAPSAVIMAPAGSGPIARTVPLQVRVADIEDPPGALTVEWKLDSASWSSTPFNPTSGNYEAAWNTGATFNGAHTLTVRATDRAGVSVLASRAVSVANSISGDVQVFLMGLSDRDRLPDLIAVKQRNTGTRSTEVHVLSGTSRFQKWAMQTGTPLPETGDTFAFAEGDWNGDGVVDLFVISKRQTITRSTEVHILSGASRFQRWILHTGTALHETGDNVDFRVDDYNRDGVPDLVAISRYATGSGRVEVHILSGASRFQRWLLNVATPLPEVDDSVAMVMGDLNRDRVPDLVVVKKQHTGTGSTEVHVLSGAARYQQWLLRTGTRLPETDNSVVFTMTDRDRDGVADLVAIKKRGTGRSTEVHILSGAARFQRWLLQTGTPIPEMEE